MVGILFIVGAIGTVIGAIAYFANASAGQKYAKILGAPLCKPSTLKADGSACRIYGTLGTETPMLTRISKTPCAYSSLRVWTYKTTRDSKGNTHREKQTVLDIHEGGKAILATEGEQALLDLSTGAGLDEEALTQGYSGRIDQTQLQQIREEYTNRSSAMPPPASGLLNSLNQVLSTFSTVEYNADEDYLPLGGSMTVYGTPQAQADGRVGFSSSSADFEIIKEDETAIRQKMEGAKKNQNLIQYGAGIALVVALVALGLGL